MSFFSFSIPTEIVYGNDSILRIGEYAKQYGNKAIIITEQKQYEKKLIQRVEKILTSFGVHVVIFDEITPESGSEDISNISIFTRRARVEVVIGIGSQKCLSIARGVSLFSPGEKSIYHYVKNPSELTRKLPVFLIPTSPCDYFALTDTLFYRDDSDRRIKLFSHSRLVTDYLFVDPAIAFDTSSKIFNFLGIEMLGNAIDSMLSKKATIISDTLLLKSIELVYGHFFSPSDYKDELSAGIEIAQAGIFLMMGNRISGPLLIQAMSLGLTSMFKLPKMIAATVVTPHVLEYYIKFKPDVFLKISKCMNIDIKGISVMEAALKVVETVQRMISDLKLPSRLSQYGIEKEMLGKLVDHIFDFNITRNFPQALTRDDVFDILYTSL